MFITALDMVKLFALAVTATILVASYEIGWTNSLRYSKEQTTKHVCTREIYPAPKEWCNEILLKEVFNK